MIRVTANCHRDALLEALRDESHPLGAAALDVQVEEPLPTESALWDAPNCLISPHCADLTSHMLTDATGAYTRNNQ